MKICPVVVQLIHANRQTDTQTYVQTDELHACIFITMQHTTNEGQQTSNITVN
jgi:hypothetical protein